MEQPKKPPRSYKGLKQKQKAKISDYMYLETQRFFQANGKMPDIDEDYRRIALEVSKHIPGLRVPIEEIYGVYVRKCPHKEPDSLTIEQDDTFFFIAGYTSGGAPYGVTWEQMGLEPWEEIE